ncbi:MAG: hypothetical protein P9F75_07455 [Candidatus Contendobacter sp.]|nr:hypothetical protein [Candidatus Contendobacter sp.]
MTAHAVSPPDPLSWADLPTDPPMPRRAPPDLNDPIHVGTVHGSQRGVHGPIALEVEIDLDRPGRVQVGPFTLTASEAARLGQMLTIAAGLLGKVARPLNPARWRG